MSIEGKSDGRLGRRLRLGMVGGGQGAFIGAVHRIAARLDDRYELIAGALSSDPDRARTSAAELRIAPERAYGSFEEMAAKEAARDDGIDVVAIVTPNHVHHPAARAFLDAGIHVICDKPMTTTVDDALDLVQTVRRTGLVFGLTHNYTGHPMVREARARVRAGELGRVRVVQVEYPQDWLTTKLEDSGQKQAAWRTDPAQSGAGGAIGDIGSHAYNLAGFITGLEAESLCADLSTFVAGRRVDDNCNVLLRYAGGARGMLWACQVAPGNENALKVRIYGDHGGLEWHQERPDLLQVFRYGEPPQLISRAGPGAGEAAAKVTRIPPGHVEGYLEAFANIYTGCAELIAAKLEGREPDSDARLVPSVEDGARGVRFITAAVESSSRGAVWTDLHLAL
jgi:predicted dehydrogenase